MQIEVRTAILSVSDKRGLAALAHGLARRGVQILSTGGTGRALREAGVAVTAISDYTGAPEILGGRVKTLHPKIHGGLLGRATPEHQAEMAEHQIPPIDLVVVNLYPFEQTIAGGASRADAVEQIDIGGPCMLRAAAKNHERVAAVVDPDDYPTVLAEIEESGGLSAATRAWLAVKAFAHTAAYDGAIAAYLSSAAADPAGAPAGADTAADGSGLPEVLTVQWRRALPLRYGENPHQRAAFYAHPRALIPGLPDAGERPALADAAILQGKPLSYNNLLDLDAALACCAEFDGPAAVVVKHTNPCGVATDDAGVAAAYRAARATDPTSAFGGIVAVNREVDEELAALLAETFLECVVAPSFSEQARAGLARKKNLRLLSTGPWRAGASDAGWTLRSVAGGVLVQSADLGVVRAGDAAVVTRRAPTDDELASLDFAWRVCKHVKSNAIVYAVGTRTAGVGAGQMSRVDAAKLAATKAEQPLAGSCAASDAFFPFRDGVDALAAAGATAVIQPGGSVRDDEVIAAADDHGMAMVFTGMRHFRH